MSEESKVEGVVSDRCLAQVVRVLQILSDTGC